MAVRCGKPDTEQPMGFHAALTRVEGTMCALVAVEEHVFASQATKEQGVSTFQHYFPGAQIVLSTFGVPKEAGPRYFGPPHIIAALSPMVVLDLPWKEYPYR